MQRTPPMPPLRQKSLTQEKSDFTSEGAPPPHPARPGTSVETPEAGTERYEPRADAPAVP